jgi:hypothetical protein
MRCLTHSSDEAGEQRRVTGGGGAKGGVHEERERAKHAPDSELACACHRPLNAYGKLQALPSDTRGGWLLRRRFLLAAQAGIRFLGQFRILRPLTWVPWALPLNVFALLRPTGVRRFTSGE